MLQYYIRERRDLNNEGETIETCEIRSVGCLGLKELSENVHRRFRSISEGELQGIFEEFIDEMVNELSQGYSVTLGDLGNFSLRIGMAESDKVSRNGKKRRPNSLNLCVKGLKYSPGKDLVKRLNEKCKFQSEGGGIQHLHQSPYSREERISRAVDYLQANHLMRLADYVKLTGLSRAVASKELRQFDGDPLVPIQSDGYGAAKVYVLKDHGDMN